MYGYNTIAYIIYYYIIVRVFSWHYKNYSLVITINYIWHGCKWQSNNEKAIEWRADLRL